MAWTQASIDRLKVAIASGTKQIMEGGRMRTFTSVDEMLRVLAIMEAEVNGSSGQRSQNLKVRFRRMSE